MKKLMPLFCLASLLAFSGCNPADVMKNKIKTQSEEMETPVEPTQEVPGDQATEVDTVPENE